MFLRLGPGAEASVFNYFRYRVRFQNKDIFKKQEKKNS